MSQVVVACALFALSFLSAVPFAAADDPPGANRKWGVGWRVGAGGAGVDYGDYLMKNGSWDMDIFKQKGQWRYGVGLTFGTLRMQPPFDHELEWAHFETYGYASRVFRDGEAVRPYLQGRLAIVRMHTRSDLFLKQPVDEIPIGDSLTDPTNGLGLSFVPGVEFDIANSFAIDLQGYLNWYFTSKLERAPTWSPDAPAMEDVGSGVEWGLRVGATWRPLSFDPPAHANATPDTTPLSPESSAKDAWNVTRSTGWAAAEVLAINFGASMFNEYVRNANFNQISPRSFWSNLEEGFHYDDNKFKTNQLIHPFNGSTYYNSSRANGLSFWPSTIYAICGAFMWEVAGETHPMSYNDMISTGIGGIAFGEATYRLSSAVLDNRSTGSGRTWREIGGFLIDPVRGFNRFLSGHATRVQGNPSNPYDWCPPHYYTSFDAGARMTGKGESITDSTETQALLDLYVNHGSPWENTRRKPFDHFDMGLQLNGDDKVPLGRFQIRGDLFSKALGWGKYRKHAVAFAQYFDYVNNNAYEFGAQSFGGAFYSRFRPSANWGIQTRVDLTWALLAAANAEYSFLAEVENRERFREYDYGPGAGFNAEAGAFRRGTQIVGLQYRVQWINVSNGSVWNPSETGSNANHYLQALFLKINVPVRSGMSVGFDAGVFLRESHYDIVEIQDISQRVPQARLYLSWDTVR
jgi:hypothetical protein